jgi:hypothetical protein
MKVDGGSTDTNFDSGNENSDYSSSSLEDVGTDSQLQKDLQSNDKQTQKAAMEHLVKLILDAIKAEQGEGESKEGGSTGGDSKGGSPQGSSKGEGSGDAASSLEDMLKELVKQAAEDAGLSDMQTEQLDESLSSTMEDQGLTTTEETT